MNSQSDKKKRLLLISIGILSVMLSASLFIGLSKTQNRGGEEQEKIIDQYSREAIDATPTGPPDPDNYTKSPIFFGTTKLLDRGVSSEQRTTFVALYKLFLSKNNISAETISLDVSSLQNEPFTPGEPAVATFKTYIDDKTPIDVRLTYGADGSIRVELKDRAGNSIADSGLLEYGADLE